MTDSFAVRLARHLGVIHRWEQLQRDGPLRPKMDQRNTSRLYSEVDPDGQIRRSLTVDQLRQLVAEHRAALKRLAGDSFRDGVRAQIDPYADVLRAWRGAWAEVTSQQGFDPLRNSAKKDRDT